MASEKCNSPTGSGNNLNPPTGAQDRGKAQRSQCPQDEMIMPMPQGRRPQAKDALQARTGPATAPPPHPSHPPPSLADIPSTMRSAPLKRFLLKSKPSTVLFKPRIHYPSTPVSSLSGEAPTPFFEVDPRLRYFSLKCFGVRRIPSLMLVGLSLLGVRHVGLLLALSKLCLCLWFFLWGFLGVGLFGPILCLHLGTFLYRRCWR